MCSTRFITILFFLSLPFGALAQSTPTKWYSVKAFLPEWNGSPVQLIIDGQVLNRGIVQKDMYSFTDEASQPKAGVLSLKKEGRMYFVPLFVEPGTIKVRDDGRDLLAYGTALNDEYRTLSHSFDSLALLQKGLAFTEYRQFKRQLTIEYVRHHPGSMVSLKLLDDYFYKDGAADDTVYHQLYLTLHPALQQSFLGRRIGAEASQRAGTAVGKVAPMLQLTDTANVKQPLYHTGKYTLVNFWASWCLPCRKEHPQLVRLYNQYKGKGFTISGVSFDQNRSAWRAAIKKEGLLWPQVVDRLAFESMVAKQYGVQVVPTNFLLDPNGVIIDRNINANMLEQKLAVLLAQ